MLEIFYIVLIILTLYYIQILHVGNPFPVCGKGVGGNLIVCRL